MVICEKLYASEWLKNRNYYEKSYSFDRYLTDVFKKLVRKLQVNQCTLDIC